MADGSRQRGDDFVARQRLHDDAGAKGQHLRGCHTQLLRQRRADALRARIAISARARVGIAGVDDQGANLRALCQMLLGDLHWRGAKAIGGKDTADARAFIQQKDAHILAPHLAHARSHGADAHASDGVQRLGLRNGEINRHRTSFFKRLVTIVSLAAQAGLAALTGKNHLNLAVQQAKS